MQSGSRVPRGLAPGALPDQVDPDPLALPVFHPRQAAEVLAGYRSGVGTYAGNQPSLNPVALLLAQRVGNTEPEMTTAGRGSMNR